MLNIEKYKDEILKYSDTTTMGDALRQVIVNHSKLEAPYITDENVLDWLCEEYKEPLLTDDEKEFLQDLMKWYKFDKAYINNMNEIVLFKEKSSENVKRYNIEIPSNFYFEKLHKLEDYTLEELDL